MSAADGAGLRDGERQREARKLLARSSEPRSCNCVPRLKASVKKRSAAVRVGTSRVTDSMEVMLVTLFAVLRPALLRFLTGRLTRPWFRF